MLTIYVDDASPPLASPPLVSPIASADSNGNAIATIDAAKIVASTMAAIIVL